MVGGVKFELAPTVFEILASEVGLSPENRQKSMFSGPCEAKRGYITTKCSEHVALVAVWIIAEWEADWSTGYHGNQVQTSPFLPNLKEKSVFGSYLRNY